MGIDREDVDQLKRAEDVGGREEALRDQGRVEGVPVFATDPSAGVMNSPLFLDLEKERKTSQRLLICMSV